VRYIRVVQYSIVENKVSRDCHVILFHNSNITVRCWQYIIYLHDSIQFDSIIDITFNMVVESIILHRGWLSVPCQSISNILEPAYQITLHDPFLGSVHRSISHTHTRGSNNLVSRIFEKTNVRIETRLNALFA
jgi:hypothetical protein